MTQPPHSSEQNIRQLIDSAKCLQADDPATERGLREAIGLARDAGLSLLEANALEVLCKSASRQGAYDARANELGRALILYRQIQDIAGQVRILSRLGNVASNTSDYVAALEYLHEAEDLCPQLEDRALVRGILGQLGIVHDALGRHDLALACAERTLALITADDDPLDRLFAFNGLGCTLSQLGRHEEALVQLTLAHQLIGALGDERKQLNFYAQSYADIALAYLHWGNPTDALENARQGWQFAAQCNNLGCAQLNAYFAGRAELALGNSAGAIDELTRALTLATDLGFRAQEALIRFELSTAYAALNRYKEAYEAHASGHALQATLQHEEAARRLEFRRVKHQIDEATREKESADRVLFSVLPGDIAERMRRGETRIAETRPDVSVLFADLVGFTAMSKTIDSTTLVERLEIIFLSFDSLVVDLGLEKIKTIGDAYMVAGGALRPQPDHLERIAALGLAMLENLDAIRKETGFELAVRIGIHAGPVVTGVLGTSKLTFDIWGETVNLASRLESSGQSGQIHVSEQVAQRLAHQFRCEPRGMVDLKGIGATQTHYLIGRQ